MADIPSIQGPGGPGGIDPAHQAKKTGPAHRTDGASFADMLKEAKSAAGAGGVDKTRDVDALLPAAFIGSLEGAGGGTRGTVSALGKEFFRLLESFQDQLSNPDISLKEIAPLLQHMETFRDKMLDDIASVPQGDPGRNLVEEMAALVSMESAKFHRGDFI